MICRSWVSHYRILYDGALLSLHRSGSSLTLFCFVRVAAVCVCVCLVALESSIVGDGRGGADSESIAPHFNSLVKMIHLAEKAPTATDADSLAVAISAVQGQTNGLQAVITSRSLSEHADVLHIMCFFFFFFDCLLFVRSCGAYFHSMDGNGAIFEQ